MSKLSNMEISQMLNGFWGHKIGMTQIFSDDRVISVTAVRAGNWIVTGIKTKKRDGYDAVQIGCLRNRYCLMPFSHDWLKKLSTYFLYMREIKSDGLAESFEIGTPFNPANVIAQGDAVDVIGKSKSIGFAGVVKRHGFGGPPGSHGSTMGNRPGTNGSLRRCGKVIKGKKLPGRTGGTQHTMKGLTVVKTGLDNGLVFLIQGSVPGKAGSLVFVRKV
jgi:large subunit ribosomal protein L3